MLFSTSRIDKYVINQDNDKLIQFFHEDLVHEVHEVSRGIGESKRNHSELVLTIASYEHHLGHVFRPNPQLIVPGPQIYL
jgi:hypothetical protein